MEMYIRSFLVTFMSLQACSAFLLSSECPVASPCTCVISRGIDISMNIDCDSKSLTAMPQIVHVQYNRTMNYLRIFLGNNSLTTIPNNAFRNLTSITVPRIELQMYSNYINMIGNDAFKGVENITTLVLTSNNLTTIPFAVSKLTHLQQLYLKGNPLRSIDPSVMPNIGGSLFILELDLGGFTEWPTDLHYLRTLQSLTADYIPFSHLDINAFRGSENTFTYLTMNYAKLEKVPQAICRLTHLSALFFMYNSDLKENRSSIFEPCGNTLPIVTSLNIEGNNLHNFPDVFSWFPSLPYLKAGSNKFQFIENSVIPLNTDLYDIFLDHNLFERIPSALNKLKSLQILDLQSNKIRKVESADLYGLSKLRYLYLSNNPLAHIDPDAFSHNPSLDTLDLRNTQLDHVPQAVVRLSNLICLILDGNQIDCTCEMSYLKHWDVSAVDIFTHCASSTETIKTFVMTSLQSCPGA